MINVVLKFHNKSDKFDKILNQLFQSINHLTLYDIIFFFTSDCVLHVYN
jgi:hypothetical protein